MTQDYPGNTIRITGHGNDSGSSNEIQQSQTGPLVSVSSTRVLYSVDTMGGNSGSPIIDEATGRAVGVHSHGGCSEISGANSGTRNTVGEFWTALNETPFMGVATLYQDCKYGGYAVGLDVGSYTLSQLRAKGLNNDDISSVVVQPGYRVIMYQNDNFSGTAVIKSADVSCLTGEGFNDQLSSIVVEPIGGGSTIHIEAEDYVYESGIGVEASSEGGENVGWLDGGDWIVWDVNLPSSGSYRVDYRIAGFGGVIQLEKAGGSPIYGQIDVPVTGGWQTWQTWQTISHTLNLDGGNQQIAIYVPSGGYNINWIQFTRQ
ncbi:carbohydrate-binding protein [Microbulbifer epialgicus]|uniref:Serine protease n=1 Tax=Microbulbifer epialgicus TaxID=393907 RepID=A0ABV4P8N5_9GAMM